LKERWIRFTNDKARKDAAVRAGPPYHQGHTP
jgi:hypothetical protein